MLIKLIGSAMVITATTVLGIMLAKFKTDRVRQLRCLISALNIFETEIKFSLSLLPDAFIKISRSIDEKAGEIFSYTAQQISHYRISACDAWDDAINRVKPNLCIVKEDTEILLSLGSSLGEMDTENQIKSVRLVIEQLKHQEFKAEEDRAKGERLFRSLGVLSGLAIVIILF